jgi:hypothetical protein
MLNKLEIIVEGKRYKILFNDVILHVYEMVDETDAGKLLLEI